MRNEITKNKELYIISRSIDNAEKCIVTEVCEDCFDIKLKTKRKYEIDESVELFTMTNNGQLYFETIVKDIKDDIISIWFPISYKYLQRRQYSRTQLQKEIVLNYKDERIFARIIDISAGGLKIETKEQLQLLNEYLISLEIENNKLNMVFEPIRLEVGNGVFISSGRFKGISSYDRISLVQYCFSKQIENSIK